MIDRAIVSTITIAVAADNPPRKAMRAKGLLPARTGRASTKVSPSAEPRFRKANPASAIGTTKMLIAMR